MINKESVLFIADGNPNIGFGHISRCITIGQEFQSNGYNVFFIQKGKEYFKKQIEENFKLFNVRGYSEDFYSVFQTILIKNRITTIIIDLIEEEYLKLFWLRKRFPDLKIVSITLFLFDIKNRYEHLSFFPDMESNKDETVLSEYGNLLLLSGPRYLVFRKEFQGLKKKIRVNANKVLVTMGGTDPYGISMKVIQALEELDELEITVLLSRVSKSYNAINEILRYKSNFNLIERSSKMSELMTAHDIIVLNGGLTRYEACLAKTPFIALSIHDKQYNITRSLTKYDVGINLGTLEKISLSMIKKSVMNLLINYELRKKMAHKMDGLFDGLGACRIFNQIVKYNIQK